MLFLLKSTRILGRTISPPEKKRKDLKERYTFVTSSETPWEFKSASYVSE
jgi:hypothetical protein